MYFRKVIKNFHKFLFVNLQTRSSYITSLKLQYELGGKEEAQLKNYIVEI